MTIVLLRQKMHLSWLKIVLLFGFGLLFIGCSAPHDNPLDPASSRYVEPVPTPDPAQLSGHIHSVHISYIFPSTDSYAVVAELDGADASLQDSVWVAYNGYPPVALSRIQAGLWSTRFAAVYFGDPQLGGIVGHPFVFTARDAEGVISTTDSVYMWRVIEGVPAVASPTALDTVSYNPTLNWQAFTASFPFGYQAKVINTTEEVETVVWTSALLQATVRAAQCPDSLPDGNYYWTITVVDSFQNTSRSKQGTFVVRSTDVEPVL
jgi:hypothetical protein